MTEELGDVKDIRDVISLGKLIRKGDRPEDVEGLVKTMAKYTEVNSVLRFES